MATKIDKQFESTILLLLHGLVRATSAMNIQYVEIPSLSGFTSTNRERICDYDRGVSLRICLMHVPMIQAFSTKKEQF